ncbi:MAG: hypothetical protein VB050_09495 [Geobacteraceae bacterium]|nr:hypothetical protein [Geobacteraceae bacterium]
MKSALLIILFCLISTGFAAEAAGPVPSYDDLAKLPVIRFGDPITDKDYILLFEPGQPINFTIAIEGTLFSQPATADVTLTTSRPVFVYREWASLDGRKWVLRSDLIKSDVEAKIPGYNYPKPGILKVRMDLDRSR